MKQQTASAELPSSYYPTLVRFRDIDDAASVEEVDPSDLASSLGPGTHLVRMLVKITDEPVTSGIGKHFKWWDEYLDKRFDGSPASIEDPYKPHISAHLTVWSFSTEAGE
jgi:hypothetical protein